MPALRKPMSHAKDYNRQISHASYTCVTLWYYKAQYYYELLIITFRKNLFVTCFVLYNYFLLKLNMIKKKLKKNLFLSF